MQRAYMEIDIFAFPGMELHDRFLILPELLLDPFHLAPSREALLIDDMDADVLPSHPVTGDYSQFSFPWGCGGEVSIAARVFGSGELPFRQPELLHQWRRRVSHVPPRKMGVKNRRNHLGLSLCPNMLLARGIQ